MPAPRPLKLHEIPSLILLTYSLIDFFKYFSKKPHENNHRGACFVSTFPYAFIFSTTIILYSAKHRLYNHCLSSGSFRCIHIFSLPMQPDITAQLDGFGDMTIIYRVLLFKIGNGAGDFDYPVVGTGTETELFKNLLQERLRCS